MSIDLEPLRGIISGITPALKKFTKAAEENFYIIRNFLNNLLITANLKDVNISGDIVISSDDAGGDFTYYNGGGVGGTDYPILTLYKSRGTVASPSVPNSGDTIFGYRGGGYTGTFGSTYTISAGVFGVATENFSSTAAGSKLEFYYTPNTTRTLTLGLILNQDGNLTIGTVAGTGSKSLYLLDGNFAGAVYHVASTTSKPSGNIPAGTAPTSPTNGDYWISSSQNTLGTYIGSITHRATMTLATTKANSSVGNTVTETTILPSSASDFIGSTTLPANFLKSGKCIRFIVKGIIRNTGTPTIQIKVYLGSTAILDTTAFTMVTTTGEKLFTLSGELICRQTGASGTVIAESVFSYFTATDSMTSIQMPNDTVITIDTTSSQVFDIKATWGTAAANNYIRQRTFYLEVLN